MSISTVQRANDQRSSEQGERDYQAIIDGAGFCALRDRLLVRVVGDDRASFLHGMCTAEIKGLAVGTVVAALFVTEHSHLIADCFIYAAPEAFLIEIEREAWASVREHLEKFLVADDVEMTEEEGLAIIDVEGPRAFSVLTEKCGMAVPAEDWRLDPATMIARLPRFGGAACTMIVKRESLEERAQALRDAEAREIDPAALDTLRIEKGIARIGVDTTEKTLALEARCERAISFSKGCYIGQETIERATARGGIKRKLYGLRIAGDEAPGVGATIMLEGHAVGKLSSVGRSPRLGVIGLAILHHSAWAEDTVVELCEPTRSFRARVAELPFADSSAG